MRRRIPGYAAPDDRSGPESAPGTGQSVSIKKSGDGDVNTAIAG